MQQGLGGDHALAQRNTAFLGDVAGTSSFLLMIVYGKYQRTLSDEVESTQRASDVPVMVAESMGP